MEGSDIEIKENKDFIIKKIEEKLLKYAGGKIIGIAYIDLEKGEGSIILL